MQVCALQASQRIIFGSGRIIPTLRFCDRAGAQERSSWWCEPTGRARARAYSRDMESDPKQRKQADVDANLSAPRDETQDGFRDEMSESEWCFGPAYATRSSDEGYGQIYGRGTQFRGSADYGLSKGQGVKVEEKGGHGTAAFTPYDRSKASGMCDAAA